MANFDYDSLKFDIKQVVKLIEKYKFIDNIYKKEILNRIYEINWNQEKEYNETDMHTNNVLTALFNMSQKYGIGIYITRIVLL